MLGIDEGGDAAVTLGVAHNVVAEGGLSARLGAVDLGDPAARHATDAECQVERDRAGGDDLHRDGTPVAESHDRAAPELLLDLQNRGIDRSAAVAVAIRTPLDHRGIHLVWGSFPHAPGGRLVHSLGPGSLRGLRRGLITSTDMGCS